MDQNWTTCFQSPSPSEGVPDKTNQRRRKRQVNFGPASHQDAKLVAEEPMWVFHSVICAGAPFSFRAWKVSNGQGVAQRDLRVGVSNALEKGRLSCTGI